MSYLRTRWDTRKKLVRPFGSSMNFFDRVNLVLCGFRVVWHAPL